MKFPQHRVFRKMIWLPALFWGLYLPAQQVELVLPEGHTYAVTTVQFSPDGKTVLTTSEDGNARIWETESGHLLHTLIVTTKGVNYASFSPDGKTIITCSDDKMQMLWNAETGKLLHNLVGHKGTVLSASFSPDGKKVVTASFDKKAIIWDVKTGLPEKLLKHLDTVETVEFSADGKKIVSACDDKMVRIWDAGTGTLLRTLYGHGGLVRSASFSPDGKNIISCSDDKNAIIWDANNGSVLHLLQGHGYLVKKTRYSPDGKLVVTASFDDTAIVWNAATGARLLTLSGHEDVLNDVRFSPDSKTIATASDDGRVIIWGAATGKALDTLTHIREVNDIQFSPNGKILATACMDRTAKLWDASTGKLICTLTGAAKNVYSAKFSNDRTKIITASGDKRAREWDASTGDLLYSIPPHAGWVMDAEFSSDNKKIITSSADGTARIWNAETKGAPTTLTGHTDYVNGVGFSDDGTTAVTASSDGLVDLWNANTGQLIYSLNGRAKNAYSVHFSNDGKKIIVGYKDRIAIIWETATGKLLKELRGHTHFLNEAQFSADDKKIVTSSYDKTAKIWDAETGAPLIELTGHSDYVKNAQFSPDGKEVITGSDDYSARLWDAVTGKLIKTMPIKGILYDVDWTKNYLISRNNSRLYFIDMRSGNELLSWLAFDSTNWVVLHPSGLFDASEGAMEKMYWTKGLEVIGFGQLKERYWEPGLWQKIMNGDTLRDVRNMDQIKLQPALELGKIEDGQLPVTLTRRDGGYGKVAVYINGKEAESDVRGRNFDTSKTKQTLLVDINHNSLIKAGQANTITVKTWSADGFVEGRGSNIKYMAPGTVDTIPSFYAVICGVSEYNSQNLKLNFAHTDAKSIATAVTLGAENLFGRAHTHVNLLTSPGTLLPTKDNIKKVFAEIAAQAKPQDILALYLSGHGITWGGESGDFYYLTTDASSSSIESYNDPEIRAKNTISTKEFTEMIKKVPALKQVMVIDACGSGKAVDNFIAERGVDASQVKAIDRMKDRTGMYIISGCAANAESFESNRYGQGLLTFSLLQAMKGAKLVDDKYVDVTTIVNYARERVPVIAAGIGGVQVPQLLIPQSGSFDIGMMGEAEKNAIPVAKVKPVFIRSNFINTDELEDNLNLSGLVDETLHKKSDEGIDLIFVDASNYPDAYRISGTYGKKNGQWQVHYKIKCGNKTVPTETLEAAPVSEKGLKKELQEAVIRKIERVSQDFK